MAKNGFFADLVERQRLDRGDEAKGGAPEGNTAEPETEVAAEAEPVEPVDHIG